MPDINPNDNLFIRFGKGVYNIIDGPVTWFRETIVEPNRKQYPWYHEKFRRVPTIDQCYDDDLICKFEANQQFKRDRAVDTEVMKILKLRHQDCLKYEEPDSEVKCKKILEDYLEASTNWFIKYGDLGGYGDAETAYMKQKHRLIWEKRNGPVGGGGTKSDEHKQQPDDRC